MVNISVSTSYMERLNPKDLPPIPQKTTRNNSSTFSRPGKNQLITPLQTKRGETNDAHYEISYPPLVVTVKKPYNTSMSNSTTYTHTNMLNDHGNRIDGTGRRGRPPSMFREGVHLELLKPEFVQWVEVLGDG